MGTCTIPAFSTLKSIFPALRSSIARATSNVTVPLLALGISPRGPNSLPIFPTDPIISGVAIALSNPNQPPFIFSIISSFPTKSAPASVASFSFSPLAKTKIFTSLPVPCGNTTLPLTIWSACLGSTPRRTARSTVSSNLAKADSNIILTASLKLPIPSESIRFLNSEYFLPLFDIFITFSLNRVASFRLRVAN